jgi:uncharacterized SAM-binding protein YcdF (DUF218 family)
MRSSTLLFRHQLLRVNRPAFCLPPSDSHPKRTSNRARDTASSAFVVTLPASVLHINAIPPCSCLSAVIGSTLIARHYLTARGVPPEAIVVEREAESTAQSVAAVAEIMRRMNLQSAIVVSDGYHIFRVKRMLESSGLKVFGSPRPSAPSGNWRERWLYYRQAVGYLLWKVGIAF